jgi:hypothetical protein
MWACVRESGARQRAGVCEALVDTIHGSRQRRSSDRGRRRCQRGGVCPWLLAGAGHGGRTPREQSIRRSGRWYEQDGRWGGPGAAWAAASAGVDGSVCAVDSRGERARAVCRRRGRCATCEWVQSGCVRGRRQAAGRARGVAGEGGRWQAAAWDTRLAVVAERERGSSATGDLQCHIGAATTQRRRRAQARDEQEQEQKCSGAEEQADSPRAQRRRAAGRRRSRASQAVAVARRAEALLSLGRGRREQASKYLGTLSSYVREAGARNQ